jgi:large subunit ribosomal protein L22
MEVKARARFIRTSPRKTRQVLDLIRGKSVEEALSILSLTHKAVARKVEKLLRSALSNAENVHRIRGVDSLIISSAKADQGPVLKRHIPRARGRATPIRKRTSHITLILQGE